MHLLLKFAKQNFRISRRCSDLFLFVDRFYIALFYTALFYIALFYAHAVSLPESGE